MTTDIQTYRIPAINFPRLEIEIGKMNRRAKKLQTEPVVLTILESVTETKRNDVIGFDYQETYHICTVTGIAPKLAGWTLVAVIEPVPNGENFIREVPGQKCPVKFRSSRMSCDHCGESRKRNAIFVLKHENGDHNQVGRNCLADFLGHENPDSMLARAEYMLTFDKLISEASGEGWGYGGSGAIVVSTTQFAITSAVVIRKIGWLPKSRAGEFERPTADIVWDICTRPNDHIVKQLIQNRRLYAEEADVKEAEAAVAWAASLDPKTESSTYLYDLGVCCRQNFVDGRRSGFVASVIAAHKRFLSENINRFTGKSKHLGTIKKRQQFDDLLITNADPYMAGVYQKTKVKFCDPNDNILIWRASGSPDWIKIGSKFTVKGTVKKHLYSAGILETEINRVEPVELDIVAK